MSSSNMTGIMKNGCFRRKVYVNSIRHLSVRSLPVTLEMYPFVMKQTTTFELSTALHIFVKRLGSFDLFSSKYVIIPFDLEETSKVSKY